MQLIMPIRFPVNQTNHSYLLDTLRVHVMDTFDAWCFDWLQIDVLYSNDRRHGICHNWFRHSGQFIVHFIGHRQFIDAVKHCFLEIC